MTTALIRYADDGGVHVGVSSATEVRPLAAPLLAELLTLPIAAVRDAVDGAAGPAVALSRVRLLPPVDGLTEVWASGVTYLRSSQARQEESQVADIYARVYDAERPELFFKGPAWRVCGHGEPIGVRGDSDIDVPEPELALVCNAHAEIVGLTVCDDVSSRSIEGDNPLYLPQAKVYAGACALGPGIVPTWLAPEPDDLTVRVEVRRSGGVAWSGQTSTARMKRRFDDLIGYLFRHTAHPAGVVLSTGTGLVPDLDFTLTPGDEVEISIDGVGTLINPVRNADGFGWLTPDADRAPSEVPV